MANAFTHAIRLLAQAIKQRDRVKSLAALDAIQPPVAILGALCVVIALSALVVPSPQSAATVSFVPLLLFVLYGSAVVAAGRKDGISPITVLWAPVYLLWRSTAFILAWGSLDRFQSKPKQRP